jgi:hypothetical protein
MLASTRIMLMREGMKSNIISVPVEAAQSRNSWSDTRQSLPGCESILLWPIIFPLRETAHRLFSPENLARSFRNHCLLFTGPRLALMS